MKHLLLPLLLAMTLLASCDVTATDRTADDEVAASKHMVPFKVNLPVINVAPDAVPVPCTLADGTPIEGLAMSRYLAHGTASHLGKIHSIATIDECVVDPIRGLTNSGQVTHFGADGSTWTLDYKMAIVPTADPVVFDVDYYYVRIIGGTGRFVGISGTGLGKGGANFADDTGWLEVYGMLER